MKLSATVALLVVLCAAAQAAAPPFVCIFRPGLVAIRNADRFAGRTVAFTGPFSIAGYNFAAYTSTASSGTGIGTGSGSFVAGGVFGGIYQFRLANGLLRTPPYIYISAFSLMGSFNTNGDNGGISASLSGASGFLGSAFMRIEEVDCAGANGAGDTIHSSVVLRDLVYEWENTDAGGQNCRLSDAAQQMCLVGTSSALPGFKFKLCAIGGKAVGLLLVGGVQRVILTPRTLELVTVIENYPYAQNGCARLCTLVATGAVTFQASTTDFGFEGDGSRWSQIRTGVGTAAINFAIAKRAIIDGVLTANNGVDIKTAVAQAAEITANGMTALNGQLNGAYANATLRGIRRIYQRYNTAGALNIWHDPSTTAGGEAPIASGSADDIGNASPGSKLAPFGVLIALVALLASLMY